MILLFLQSKADEKEVMMVTPHFDIACHIDEKQASKHITTRVCQRRASITSARRNATPKVNDGNLIIR